MPKFPKDSKSYKQPPLPMIEGTAAHTAALAKSSPTKITANIRDFAAMRPGGVPRSGDPIQEKLDKPHYHSEDAEGVVYPTKTFAGMGTGGRIKTRWEVAEGGDEGAGYKSSRGTA